MVETAAVPIQFQCPGCRQPIEVDDEHAGKVAACPYCGGVANVPLHSTYSPGAVAAGPVAGGGADHGAPATVPVTAAPHASQPPPPYGPYPADGPYAPVPEDAAAQAARQRLARRHGNYALVCAAIVLALMAALAVLGLLAFIDKAGAAAADGRLTQEQAGAIQAEVMKELQNNPLVLGLGCSAELLSVVGLVLSIASVVRVRRGNWRGLVALIFFIGCTLCMCAGVAVQLLAS